MIRKFAAGAAGIVLVLAASTGVVFAKDGDVFIPGTCSGSSQSKIKVESRPSNRRTEVEFEVDEATPHQKWAVVIADNGTSIAHKTSRTNARGEFTVRKFLKGATGHSILASATNAVTGETCTATAAD